MPVRLKVLLGGLALVAMIAVYCIVTVSIATVTLGESSPWLHLAFFGISGLLWLLPAMLLIRWMYAPSERSGRR